MNNLIVANWKMNGSLAQAQELVISLIDGLQDNEHDIVICPPFPYLLPVAKLIQDTSYFLGAQNICQHDKGAYTGEVSAAMLQDVMASYVIIGHSERREHYAETDALVAAKVRFALASGMKVILCVGEPEAIYSNGETLPWIKKQLADIFSATAPEHRQNLIVAYEPIWSIGTGTIASLDEIVKVTSYIKSLCSWSDLKVLYGGSVVSDNVSDLLKHNDIDGVLVGGASIRVQDFIEICRG